MNWRVGPLLWVVLLLALFCPAQTAPDKPPPPLPYIDPDAYDVYSAIVPTLPIYQSAGTVVVQRETAPNNDLGTPRQCLHGDKQFQDDYAEVFDDYEQENRSAKLLEPNFDFDKPFDFISIDDFVRPAATRGRTGNAWGAFFHRFPDSGGYVVVSAVGFNSEKTAAVLYVGRKCGPDCGGGSYHLMENRDGKWQELSLIEPSCSSNHGG